MQSGFSAAIIGAGALGTMYGGLMADAFGPERIFFAADSGRAARYRSQGFILNGIRRNFTVRTPDEAQPVSFAVFAVKEPGLLQAMEIMRPFIGPDTVLISLLNGITSEQQLAGAYRSGHILLSVVQGTDALREENRIEYHSTGKILLGSRSGEYTPDAAAADDFLCRAGIPHEICSDMPHRQWNKLMFNAGLNQVCAVCDVPYRGVQQPGKARDLMIAAMREARTAAALSGVTLTEDDIALWLKLLDSFSPESMPSMRQDTLAHRKTEAGLFGGTICSIGEAHGTEFPVNRMLLQKLRRIEASF